ncbi:MAG: polyhydroxyalkanoate synthesis repressor PhaR [Proteobacteria bacterium]|nr:MAG: polyhydroxyalkanoate synthesis repressor PhaR [Pseudomonadota bacterium]
MIIIKKYPNRRLYDTSSSQYVNLEYVRKLVLRHEEFQIVDSKSNEDLTKSMLLQIITEQETTEQQSLLTNTVLKQLIRFYGNDMQGVLRQYIEQSLAIFMDQQDTLQSIFKELMNPKESLKTIGQRMEKHLELWKSMIKRDKKE